MLKFKVAYSQKKLLLIMTTTVFSFSAMTNSFYLMGLSAIPWFLLTALCFFIPYSFIIAEYSYAYKDQPTGIYFWVKDTSSKNLAMIATFLWYCSYIVWLVSLFMKLWIPLSIFLFGRDLTQSQGDSSLINSRLLLGLLSIIVVCFLSWICSRGFNNVARMMSVSGWLILLLFFLAIAGQLLVLFKSSVTLDSLAPSLTSFTSPNPDYQSLISQLSFFMFSITAFGGLDTIASLVDKMANEFNRFSRSLIISAFLTVLLYLVGLCLWLTSVSNPTLFHDQTINLGNAMYFMMYQLGIDIGSALHISQTQQQLIGEFFLRFNGLVLFITYLGLLTTIIYTPLKTFFHSLTNQKKLPKRAFWWQAVVICLIILIVSSNNQTVSQLYNQLTLMTNLSRALPYLIVAFSFFNFHKASPSGQLVFIANQKRAKRLSISVILSISVAIFFTLLKPILVADYKTAILLILGPILFTTLSLIHNFRLKNKTTTAR